MTVHPAEISRLKHYRIMSDFQQKFIDFAIHYKVLCFGNFKTKAGRLSPYFFNTGLFNDGHALRQLGQFYAQAILDAKIPFDALFGPAYKGIPLVSAIAIALAEHGHNHPFSFNRKEAKDHGEGGTLVGALPRGRVVIVDDVLTAGTALRQAVALLREAGAEPVAAVIALDRQERGASGRSAVQEMEQDSGVRVIPLVTVQTVLEYLGRAAVHPDAVNAIRAYQAAYGVSA